MKNSDRQHKILELARKHPDNDLALAIIEFADIIAEECLANSIHLNGILIYQKEVK